ncbi:2,3-diaminopropionate biosynthesis protein SbnA [Ktedonobacter sp. SOSP1-52]|uniref:pyridoxal-phosphate dependent enzyme n=1 Tax=Ktedonobacter sp. SOSP1-52 TaxID=2778366 RepID=UPI001915E94C|nr:pyridoxal-phosphate dependent enzyme [Ktedonobacter sp. SOSP1-52]GHO70208.1 2,3-diaminopropionate biosynthesis protein SbnA [Ktedonobacter sp. SOSP1-52]
MINFSIIQDVPLVELSNMVQSIGNTPIHPIQMLINKKIHTVHLKLECENPTGSMKDRTGYGLIQDLEDRGLLSPSSTIVESTSGNLGVALALICKSRRYQFIAVVDPKTTQENISKMEALNARIDYVQQPDENGGYLLSRLARVQELCALNEQYVWTNQYANSANPTIHYLSTGPEIYQQMNGKLDAIFAPVSTGGTLAGIGRYLRKVHPATTIVGVDAHGSMAFGAPPATRRLTGIGSSRRSNFITHALYDHAIHVRDEEAFAYCHALYEKTGLLLGGSSGCVLFACANFLATHPDMKDIVCVCADSGENYKTTIFERAWLQQLNIDYFEQQHQLALDTLLPELQA